MNDIQIQLSAGTTRINFRSLELPERAEVICDSNLQPQLEALNPIVVPAGETSKSMAEYERLLNRLAHRNCKRGTTLVAIGGGVIGDLAGFVAATYMRGIPLIQVPTTLLAMVDSSVGGKVGIDTSQGKNLVGAFYPAEEVYIDPTWLQTLPARQWQSGMAEVLKYGFIMDHQLSQELTQSPLQDSNDPRTNPTIRRCIDLKKHVVEADEFETTGLRAVLNFGHTVGHAIEKLTNYEHYTHGEAISIGMVIETKIGEKLGFSEAGLSNRIEADLKAHGLPTKSPTTQGIENIIQSMRGDKKSMNGELSMSLVSRVGACALVKDIPVSLVQEVLREH